jgi:hypothetical protein
MLKIKKAPKLSGVSSRFQKHIDAAFMNLDIALFYMDDARKCAERSKCEAEICKILGQDSQHQFNINTEWRDELTRSI